MNIPSVELRSAYYAVQHGGVVHHVFNGATMEYGEVCRRAAQYLTGRHKPTYKNNKASRGDVVVVCNAEQLRMRGDELRTAKLRYHTGHPGGLKTRLLRDYVVKKPEFLFYYGVYKQLPKNRLRFAYMQRLFVYSGPEAQYASFLPNVG